MDKAEIVRRILPVLAASPHVLRAELFGSVARGEAGPGSDVDLIVALSERAGLFDLAALSTALESALGRGVSLVDARIVDSPRRKSQALFAANIRADREPIYERAA